ncbi:MAG: glycosyltransferase [Chloroflexi bacterium]|nr:glycosyltransferase [Chloroflexota bacterium]
MKIALIAPTHLPSRRANTIQVMKMAQAMTVLGHELRVMVPGSSPEAGMDWDELAHHYGLQHRFDVQWLPAHPRLRRYEYGLTAVRHARRWDTDLIYTRLPQAAAIASFLGMGTILEIHDLPQGTLGPWLFSRFLRGRGARRLVVITRALGDALAQNFTPFPPAPFTLIAPDGVDLSRYKNLPTPAEARQSLGDQFTNLPTHQFTNLPIYQFTNPQFTAGYTGHLYPGRGTQLILDIAAHLPNVTFLLVGGDPADVSRLRAEASRSSLDNVILTGFVPNAELPQYQAACDVLLMPYRQRVAASSGGDIARYLSPMKLFEYLACGRAILSSDLPVLREVLTPNNAVLLPPDDADAWAAAIRDLQADPAQRESLSEQARRDAQNYTWEARAGRILEGL